MQLQGEQYQKVFQNTSKSVKALMENYRVWIPRAEWIDPNTDYTKASTTLFDCVAVYLAYSENLVEMERLPIGVSRPAPAPRDDYRHFLGRTEDCPAAPHVGPPVADLAQHRVIELFGAERPPQALRPDAPEEVSHE